MIPLSSNPNLLYFIGIIDYFQLYTMKKRLERFYKSARKCKCGLDTSSQPPNRYAVRFVRKLTQYMYEVKLSK